VRAIANAGPLIHLSWVNRLDCLKELFEQVVVPEAVRDEVLRADENMPGVSMIRAAFEAGWLSEQSVRDRNAVARLTNDLDIGEAEAIVLMEASGADILLLDDRRARVRARNRGLAITGTIGLLRLARDMGLGLVDRLPALKHLFIREAAGLLGEVPKLLRGEAL